MSEVEATNFYNRGQARFCSGNLQNWIFKILCKFRAKIPPTNNWLRRPLLNYGCHPDHYVTLLNPTFAPCVCAGAVLSRAVGSVEA